MSSDQIAISVTGLSKCYQIYDKPEDRLKQSIVPRFQSLFGLKPVQYFHNFWALKDISFEIKKGETVGIIGRNGSGKSTLLQIICGTLTPSSGSVETYGRIAALLELGSVFNPEFTGRENVYMNAAVLGLSKQEVDARFNDIAAFADIGDFIEQPVKTYSSGMMVRLAFAVAINVDPQILIVDEALSVGDELFQRKCFSRIEAIKQNGATILFVSHSGGTIVELCDHAVLLDSGEKLAMGVPKTIVGKYQKLIYAPQDKRDSIRDEIKTSADFLKQRSQLDVILCNPVAQPHAEESVEFFDPHLKSGSTIEYESHGAHIEAPMIKTLGGRQVNSLIRGKKYQYSYQVKFSRAASRIRFGMVIRTISGFSLGGALSASAAEVIPMVEAGTVVSVEFMFECSLNPGTYFLNAGVFGAMEQEETVLHRLVDAVAFRVAPIEKNLATEVIDFGCVPGIKIYE